MTDRSGTSASGSSRPISIGSDVPDAVRRGFDECAQFVGDEVTETSACHWDAWLGLSDDAVVYVATSARGRLVLSHEVAARAWAGRQGVLVPPLLHFDATRGRLVCRRVADDPWLDTHAVETAIEAAHRIASAREVP